MTECTLESFMKDVDQHQIKIIRDDGVYRHVRFARPDSGTLAFELVTWPGHLCYTGDMGTYVFQHGHDMFNFFRPPLNHKSWGNLGVKTDYWAEKCISADPRYGVSRYSPAKAKEEISDILDSEEASEETRGEVEERVSWYADSGVNPEVSEAELRDAAEKFCSADGFKFRDFGEVNLHVRPYHYLWACYAIAWGVLQYDAEKARIEP